MSSIFYSNIQKERNKSVSNTKNSPRLPKINRITNDKNLSSDEKSKKKLKSSMFQNHNVKAPNKLK